MAGLFKSMFGKNGTTSQLGEENTVQVDRKDIAEDLFIEKKPILDDTFMASTKGILAIYHYLESDFEGKGFDDAMINPDESYKKENIRLIKFDLVIIIQKVRIYHDSLLKEIDIHFKTKSYVRLIDLVEEHKSHKADLL